MGRLKTVHTDLPAKMVTRISGGRRLFYFNGRDGKRVPLGDNLSNAIQRHNIYIQVASKHHSPKWDLRHKPPEEILADAMPMAPVCGIYFLIAKGEIMYVGQSRDLWQRMQQHRQKKYIIFEAISWVRCTLDKLDETEAFYINELRPKHNRRIPIMNRLSRIVDVGLVESNT